MCRLFVQVHICLLTCPGLFMVEETLCLDICVCWVASAGARACACALSGSGAGAVAGACADAYLSLC